MLARDAIAVMDGLGLKKVNWLGLSMGGMEGMWLGANAPRPHRQADPVQHLHAITPTRHCGTPASTRSTKAGSVAAIADMVINAWLTQDFQKNNPTDTARMKEMMIATPVEGYLGCCAAVRDMDHREIIKAINAPT